MLHFTTPGKCNTYVTSINNNTNNNRLDKNLFNNLITDAPGSLLWKEPEPARPYEGSSMTKFENQLGEYLEYCEKVRKMSPQTIRGKKWVCKSLLESVKISKIEELSNKHVNEWVMEQTARGCSGRTVNTRLTFLVAMVHYFQDMGVVMPKLKLRFIVKLKEEPPRRVCYTKEQLSQVLRYADRFEWLLIKVCFDCGLRISELRNLRLMNLDGRRVSFLGKGSKSREAYIGEDTRKKLDDWIQRERVTDYLWVVDDKLSGKRQLSVDDIRHRMRKPFYKAGYKDFHPHALRHSFATDVVSSGAPLAIAKEMLGHSNIATTERYVHTFEGHLKEYFDQYKFAT